MQSAPTKSEPIEASTEGLRRNRKKLTREVADHKGMTENQQVFIKAAADKKPELVKKYEDMKDKHARENEKTTFGRAGRRIIGN